MMRKIQMVLLTGMILSATLFAGCGNQSSNVAGDRESVSTEETSAESEPKTSPQTVTTKENTDSAQALPSAGASPLSPEAAYETVSYTVGIASVDGEMIAYDREGQAYVLTLAESLPEEEAGLLQEGAVLVVSEKLPAGTVKSADTSLTGRESDTLAYAVEVCGVETVTGEAEAAETAAALFYAVNGFRVEPVENQVKYAKSQVNVRKGPSSDYELTGVLSGGQEVTVTGVADNGWYQILLGDGYAYVSDRYLADEKPAASPAGSGNPSGGAGAAQAAGTGSALAETPVAAVPTAEDSASANGAVYCTEIVDLINQMRTEEGKNTLSWSDAMAATALERAGEIVSNFSHDGMRNCTAEIITMDSRDGVQNWFNNFYESPPHYAAMSDSGAASVAAARCDANGCHYVVVIFDTAQ